MISWKKIENYKFKTYQYKQPRVKPKQKPIPLMKIVLKILNKIWAQGILLRKP